MKKRKKTNKKSSKKMWFVIVGIIILIAVVLFINNKKEPAGNFDAFAKCLTENGAKMYGASWCTHCQAQKRMFGTSFSYIKYVECANKDGSQTTVCKNAGIEGYPTWDIKGEKISGELSVLELSDKTGCSLELIN